MANKPSFSMIEVAPGRRLHYLVEGPEGAPFVLYDAGAFGIYADGWWVKEALKHDFRVCLYDRAGLGASDPMPQDATPTPDFHVEDMRRLVAALGHQGPITLVGHSMAGLRLHTFANLYQQELSGLVFVDAVSPRSTNERSWRFGMTQFGNMLRVGALTARWGWTAPFASLAPNNFQLSGDMRDDKVWSYANQEHHEGAKNEVVAVDFEADYLRGDGITQLPIAIFASTTINGMSEKDATRSRGTTGYGWFGNYPREDHVSILTGVYAQAIAGKVREITAHLEGAAVSMTGT